MIILPGALHARRVLPLELVRGHVVNVGQCLRAELLLEMGEIERARRAAREAVKVSRKIEEPYEIALARRARGLVCKALGRNEKALEEIEGAAQSLRSIEISRARPMIRVAATGAPRRWIGARPRGRRSLHRDRRAKLESAGRPCGSAGQRAV